MSSTLCYLWWLQRGQSKTIGEILAIDLRKEDSNWKWHVSWHVGCGGELLLGFGTLCGFWKVYN